MGRINQEIVEYGFSQKATLSYELNVLVGSDSIYYMVNDAQLNVLILKSFHFDHQNGIPLFKKLSNTFLDDPILQEPFGATRIVLTTPHFTLIPTKFFNDNDRRVYFRNLTELSVNDAIEVDTLRNIDFKNLYAVDATYLKQVITLFPNARIYHYMSPLIMGCQHLAESLIGHQVFANVRDGWVHLLFFDGYKPIFANAYPFRTPQDFIYYILLIYEQFKLNPETIPLSLGGSLTETSEFYRFTYRFIRHIHWVSIPEFFQLGNQFAGIPPHFYFDLFCTKLCE